MLRRFAILVCIAVAYSCTAQAPNASPAPTAGATAQTGELLPDEQIQQVLNRLAFGPRPGDAARVRRMGVARWIDTQLHPERIDDGATEQLVREYSALNTPTADIVRDFNTVQRARRQAQKTSSDSTASKAAVRREVMAEDPQLANAARATRGLVGQVQSARLARAVTSERQLDEVMVDFWENHFSVYSGKGQTRLYLAAYDRDVIRPHALGKFRDLLGAVAKSPAMLFFLDNWESAADSTRPTLGLRPGARGVRRIRPGKRGLNENYARELMELHTLGVDGGYTQKDVQEVARTLTGWTFNRQTGEFVFNPRVHDAGEKVVLGHTFPAGHGQEEGEQVLDLLARAPATAHFITTKLARRFVSDDPPSAVVDRCADRFSRTDGDIRETVRCIVTSPEFFSRAAYRAKVKTPFEVVASGLRALGAEPDPTPRTAQVVARLGQPIFGRQTPDGWPDHADAWMNTGAILNRINFGLSLAGGQVPGARVDAWPGYAAANSLPRAQQVDSVVASMLGGRVSTETREVLMSGENPMLASSSASDANGMSADPSGRGARLAARSVGGKGAPRGRGAGVPGFGRPVNLQGLAQVIGLALGAPEFQRR